MIVLLEEGVVAPGRRVAIPAGEQHHLRVRRAREGETLELRDGRGLVGVGRLVQSPDAWAVEVDRAERAAPPPMLVLATGAGDRERFGWVVEKGVELGVTAVVPLETERTRSVAGRVRPGQLDRLRRQALEAVKQSGNPWVCAVEEPMPLVAFLAQERPGARWLADPAGDPPPPALDTAECTVVVGPEGGLTASERETVLAAGYRAVALGPHILRLETAALAAAAAVQAGRLRTRHG